MAESTSRRAAAASWVPLLPWLSLSALFGVAEGLVVARNSWDTFIFSSRIGAGALVSKLGDLLGRDLPSPLAEPYLSVPTTFNLVHFVSRVATLYLLLGLAAGLTMWILAVALPRVALLRSIALHAATATFALGSVTLGMATVHGRRDSLAAVLPTWVIARPGIPALLLAELGVLVLALLIYRITRPRGIGPPRHGFWLVAALVLVVSTLGALAATAGGERAPGSPLAVAGGAPPCSSSPFNIVLVSIDTLRADHLSLYGYARETSPALAERARQGGIVFERCASQSAWTAPSHMSIFTSTYPLVHGVTTFARRPAESQPTLTALLKELDYWTVGITSAATVSSAYGFERGFDAWEDPLNTGDSSFDARYVTDRGLHYLDQRADRRFFLFLHYFDPHTPLTPPEPYRQLFVDPEYSGSIPVTWNGLEPYALQDVTIDDADLAHLIALYDAEIRFVDDQLRRLFDYLDRNDLADETIVVVTSDHGEEFKDHGSLFHGQTLYEEMIRVPLVFLVPGTTGRRVPTLVRSIDIAPSLLGLLGCPAPPGFEGVSVFDTAGELDPPTVIAYSDTTAHRHQKAVIIDDLKLILGPFHNRVELYDLVDDPRELNNLAAASPETVDDYRKMIYQWFRRSKAQASALDAARGAETRDAELLEQLRALGYID